LPRFFRIYGKKRGDRRTGSRTLGSVGEVVFFSFFLAVGLCALAWLAFRWLIPEWQVVHGFRDGECTVTAEAADESPTRLDTAVIDGRRRYRPQVHITYTVNGQTYDRWTYDISGDYLDSQADAQVILEQFTLGSMWHCFYDPINPSIAVVVRGYSPWLFIALLVPATFIIIGGAGLTRSIFLWGRSAEQRSVDLQRVAALTPWQQTETAQHLPYVPHGANLTNSPGTTLAYRLPTGAQAGWRVFALGAASVLWNGIVLALLALYVTGGITADPPWILWVMFLVAIPAGWGLVYLFVRQLLLTSGVGPTLVEISDNPLIMGERYEVFLSQTGKLSLKKLQLDLECEEEATYRQGTDTRTDRRRVVQQTLWQREQFEIEQGLPFEVRCELRLPAGGMHSFLGSYNAVHWNLVVRAELADWPNFERSFPIVVHPRKEATP